VRGKKVAVLGLTFKPNTDDMRDSPAIAIVRALQDAGAEVAACDPEGIEQARPMLDNVAFSTDPWTVIEGAVAAVLVTEWDAYRGLDLKRMQSLLAQPVLVDLRNVYDRAQAEGAGLQYHAVGR
jgi:UDPglucose 6-dehydrogenase